MRLLRGLVFKLIKMALTVVVLGAVMRYARPYIMKMAGMPEDIPGASVAGAAGAPGLSSMHFGSEESDLMATVLKSAFKFLSGSAKKEELAGELSEKLYAGRGDNSTMAELGIQMERPDGKPINPTASPKPGAEASASGSPANGTVVAAGSGAASSEAAARRAAKVAAAAAQPNGVAANPAQKALFDTLWAKMIANPELSLVPIFVVAMGLMHFVRKRRKSLDDEFLLPDMSKLMPSEGEAYEMTHDVHSLPEEDFELLVGLIYQRQGYRLSMPAARSGGCGGDFMAQRKQEKLLLQCKKLCADYKVPVDRLKELHEAATAAGATRGVYVATCNFSWDARNYARANGVTVINARMLDTLLNEACETPDEDLLAVEEWAPTLMKKVKLTPPLCPACEAPMDEVKVSSGSVWLCSDRPECRGRRSARKYDKSTPVVAKSKSSKRKSAKTAKGLKPEKTEKPTSAAKPQDAEPAIVFGGRKRTINPSPPPPPKPVSKLEAAQRQHAMWQAKRA